MAANAPTSLTEQFAALVRYEAAKLAVLIADETTWVERRVETVTFISETWHRRHTSVHFDVPVFPVTPGRPSEVALIWVPIAMLKKGVLRKLDVRDERGAALPVLSARQERMLARALLVQSAEALLAEKGKALEPSLRNWLHELTAVEATVSFDPARVPPLEGARELFEHSTTRSYLKDLSRNFMLLARIDAKPETTRIVKFAYDSQLGAWETRRRLSFRTAFGFSDYRDRVDTPAIFDCRSYHVEVPCPEELMIADAYLHDVMESRHGRTDREPLSEDHLVDRAHLYTSGTYSEDVQDGYVVVGFRLKSQVVFPVFVLTVVVASMIVGGLAVHFFWPTAVRAETAAVVVVAIPSFFAPFVVPGDHPIVKRMFFGLRILAFLAGACSFVAAASLAINPSTRSLVIVWSVLAAFSCLLAVIAGSATLHSRRRSAAAP